MDEITTMAKDKMNRCSLIRQLPNLITAYRLICSLILYFFLHQFLVSGYKPGYYLICITVMISAWISDFVDGNIARKFMCESKFGAYFDVLTDCVFIFSLHVQLTGWKLVPLWFDFVILEKILNYMWTSKAVCMCGGEEFCFIRDPIGKLVSAFFYVVPFLACMECFLTDGQNDYTMAVIYLLSIFAVVSSVTRISTVVGKWRVWVHNLREIGVRKRKEE